jgi:hypothetical protein
MSIQRNWRPIVAAVGVASLGPAMLIATPKAGAQSLPEPLALAGTAPGEGFSIVVDVLPSSAAMKALPTGKSLAPYRLDQSSVQQAGASYSVAVDPTQIPSRYLDPAGIVTFQITAQDPATGAVLTTVASARGVRVGADSPPVWADPVASADGVAQTTQTASGSTNTMTATSSDGLPVLASAAADGVGVTDPGALTPIVAPAKGGGLVGQPTAQAATAGNCVGPGAHMMKKASKLVYATLGTTYPVGKSKAFMMVSASQGAAYGSGLSVSGKYGTWSASGTKHSDGNWSKTWLGSSSSRSYQKQVEYFKWEYQFLDSRCNYFRWIANQETGGTTSNTGIARPDFGNCVPEDPGPWARTDSKGTSYSYDAAVKFSSVIGVDLSISRNYSTSQFVQYDIVGRKRLCGSDTWPTKAGKIMEKKG